MCDVGRAGAQRNLKECNIEVIHHFLFHKGIFRVGAICSFTLPLLFPVFVETALAGCAEVVSMTSRAAYSDSLRLRYSNIDPSDFPRIVSLVTITNNAGFIIGKLNEDNFEVREDGVRELPIDVVELADEDFGVSVVLTIDRSGSMQGQPISDAKNAASAFVELMQSKDQSAIVSFATLPQTDCPFSGDKDSLLAAISSLAPAGSTAIYDALIHSADLVRDAQCNPAIILLTDGADNKSQFTYQEALNVLIPLEVQVFTIGLGLNRNSPEEDILIDLAAKTDGSYYYSPTSSDLEEIYRGISQRLHHRYEISYTTHNPAKDGTLRHVRIDVGVRSNASSDTASYRAPYDGLPPDPPTEENAFQVIPNPFTPNDDGFNDRTEFRQENGIPPEWIIVIMERSGRKIRQLTNGERYWDGRDEAETLMLPGAYLYTVSNGHEVIHRGIVQLIR